MSLVKVTKKYQITIPKDIRIKLNISIGDLLKIKLVDNYIVIEPIKPIIKDPVEYLSNLISKPINIDAVNLSKNLGMKIKAYIDTNIYLYVALKNIPYLW